MKHIYTYKTKRLIMGIGCSMFSIYSSISYALTPHETSLPIVNITLDEDSFQLMETTHRKEIEPTCQFSLTAYDESINQPLRIQLAGSGSRWGALKSYELKSNKKNDTHPIPNFFLETDVLKYKALKLRTTTSLYHEKQPLFNGLAHNAFMRIFGRNCISGLDYQETLQVVAYINNEYRGIYDLTETSNMKYIKSKYNLDDDEVNFCKLTMIGDTIDWEYKDRTDSIAFQKMHQSILSAATYEEITSIIDIDNLIDYYLCEVYFQNSDWLINNCIVWREKAGGKWKFILNDLDYAGLNVDGGNFYLLQTSSKAHTFIKSVFQKLCKFMQFRSHFCDRIFIACATYLHGDRIRETIDSIAANVRDEIPYQAELYKTLCKKFQYSEIECEYYDDWEYTVTELSNWGYKRKYCLYPQMASLLQEPNNIIPVNIYTDRKYLFNGEYVREDYDGEYLLGRTMEFTDEKGEFLSCTAHFMTSSEGIVENTYSQPFVIPNNVTKAEIYINEDLNLTKTHDNITHRNLSKSEQYDIQGKIWTGKNPHSIRINSHGEKYIDTK